MISAKFGKGNGQIKKPFSSMLDSYQDQKLTFNDNLHFLKNKFPH